MSQPKSTSEYRVALKAAEAKIVRLEVENGQLKERVRKLEDQLETAQRAAKRQAAPFSRGRRQPSGRPPGRRSGAEHGRHGHRQAPEGVDEELFAGLPECCPDCGGELAECAEGWEQYQEELPEIRALVTRVSGKWARCTRCTFPSGTRFRIVIHAINDEGERLLTDYTVEGYVAVVGRRPAQQSVRAQHASGRPA